MAAGAEKKISQCTYTKENRNWTFKKYANLFKQQHNILESLKEQGYIGIDEQSNVRYLIEGINTTYLDSVKIRNISDESLCQDFDGCVTLYNNFVKKLSVDNRQLLGIVVSSINNASGNMSVILAPDDRYYDSN